MFPVLPAACSLLWSKDLMMSILASCLRNFTDNCNYGTLCLVAALYYSWKLYRLETALLPSWLSTNQP